MRDQVSDSDFEQISAYLDGQLSAGDQLKLEQRFKSRPELTSALDDIRRTRALIRMAPRRKAPRNFTLTPAMVGEVRLRRNRWSFSGLFPALSFASALATLVLIASIVFELLPGMSLGYSAKAPAQAVAMQPQAASPAMKEANRVQEQQDTAPSTAMPTATPEIAQPKAALAPQPTPAASPMAAIAPTNQPLDAQGAAPAENSVPGPIAMNPPSTSGNYASPPNAYGKGGGGGGEPVGGTQGQGYASPNGAILVPFEGSGDNTRAPQATVEAGTGQPGGGPILGIPPAEQSGQIINQSAWGKPASSNQAAEEKSQTEPQPGAGLSTLRLTQALLGLLAVMTGLTAYFIWKRERN